MKVGHYIHKIWKVAANYLMLNGCGLDYIKKNLQRMPSQLYFVCLFSAIPSITVNNSTYFWYIFKHTVI